MQFYPECHLGSAPIQKYASSDYALFISWKSLDSADSDLNNAENENFKS